MRCIYFLAALLFFSLPSAQAQAGETLECGQPEVATLKTDPNVQFCDVYTRQLAYREQRLAFRKKLDARAKNYVATGNEARRQYRDNLNALNASR